MADLQAKHFIRKGSRLEPADFVAEEWLEQFPEGTEISITARRSRSSKNHKHFFAVLHYAFKHLEAYQSEDDLLDAIKIACGHTRPVMKQDGEVIWLPKSIDWDNMGEEEFKRFKNRAIYVLDQLCGFDVIGAFEDEIRARERARAERNW